MSKFFIAILFVMVASLAKANTFGQTSKVNMLCQQDLLTQSEARVRNSWALKCGHIDDTEEEYCSRIHYKNVLCYPTFATKDLLKSFQIPIDHEANCKLPNGITVVTFCSMK